MRPVEVGGRESQPSLDLYIEPGGTDLSPSGLSPGGGTLLGFFGPGGSLKGRWVADPLRRLDLSITSASLSALASRCSTDFRMASALRWALVFRRGLVFCGDSVFSPYIRLTLFCLWASAKMGFSSRRGGGEGAGGGEEAGGGEGGEGGEGRVGREGREDCCCRHSSQYQRGMSSHSSEGRWRRDIGFEQSGQREGPLGAGGWALQPSEHFQYRHSRLSLQPFSQTSSIGTSQRGQGGLS